MRGKPSSLSSRTVSVDGNRLILLPDGPDRLEALLGMIASARSSVRVLFYIFAGDAAGRLVRDALVEACRRGVAVSLLIDDFGSSSNPDHFFAALRAAGGRVCRFHPSWGRRYLLRNHQKMLLIDGDRPGSRVLIGGFNIEDDYFKPADQGGWRDIGLIVDGPAAARLAPYFDALMDWAATPRARIRQLRTIIQHHSETSGKLQWQFGGPMRRASPWAVSTARDLNQGCDVEVIAAYFAPPWSMLRRIGRVGTDGRARVITAAKSDNTATIFAARFTYNQLMKRGVDIYEYQRTKLHTKLLVFDDEVHIGSSNFDIRSLYLNLEMMLRVDDPEFTSMMRVYFEGELDDSLKITREAWDKKLTFANRVKWALSFFMVTAVDYTVTRRLNFGAE
ncbi:MAG TPA: phosphatidylserine/phosphatidylglycerophosphate/cardiolipin synthase family protein [Sphingomicrobium sp.]|jgi:cardiolipin synthase A/B|nr:phosphatidylserine/phosphatidylglycerophosphate/cardiolipin synthase family protein [Sphingomicrobium sp.]